MTTLPLNKRYRYQDHIKQENDESIPSKVIKKPVLKRELLDREGRNIDGTPLLNTKHTNIIEPIFREIQNRNRKNICLSQNMRTGVDGVSPDEDSSGYDVEVSDQASEESNTSSTLKEKGEKDIKEEPKSENDEEEEKASELPMGSGFRNITSVRMSFRENVPWYQPYPIKQEQESEMKDTGNAQDKDIDSDGDQNMQEPPKYISHEDYLRTMKWYQNQHDNVNNELTQQRMNSTLLLDELEDKEEVIKQLREQLAEAETQAARKDEYKRRCRRLTRDLKEMDTHIDTLKLLYPDQDISTKLMMTAGVTEEEFRSTPFTRQSIGLNQVMHINGNLDIDEYKDDMRTSGTYEITIGINYLENHEWLKTTLPLRQNQVLKLIVSDKDIRRGNSELFDAYELGSTHDGFLAGIAVKYARSRNHNGQVIISARGGIEIITHISYIVRNRST